MTKRPEFNVRGFHGSVILKAFTNALDGQQYIIFEGTVSIIEDKAMLGFDVTDRETNWVARVDGPTQSYNFPGCQVRGVVVHSKGATSNQAHLVP